MRRNIVYFSLLIFLFVITSSTRLRFGTRSSFSNNLCKLNLSKIFRPWLQLVPKKILAYEIIKITCIHLFCAHTRTFILYILCTIATETDVSQNTSKNTYEKKVWNIHIPHSYYRPHVINMDIVPYTEFAIVLC